VSDLASIYRTLLRVAIAENIQYRASGMVWMLGMFIEPLVYLAVWDAVADGRGGNIAGYDAKSFAAYYLALFVINHLTFTWIMEVFQYRIQMGSLSFELLRPIHPIHADIAENIGYKLVMSVVMLPAAATIYFIYEPRFAPQAWSLALLPVAIALAFFTRFCFEWVVALSAFWTTRTTAVNRTYYAIFGFLSGRVAPLSLLPGWLGKAAQMLPFYYFVGFPVELAVGKLTLQQALRGLCVQALWTALGLLTVKLVWARAVRTFSAVGS
jgi:ABC-2 type transport system permease protein